MIYDELAISEIRVS